MWSLFQVCPCHVPYCLSLFLFWPVKSNLLRSIRDELYDKTWFCRSLVVWVYWKIRYVYLRWVCDFLLVKITGWVINFICEPFFLLVLRFSLIAFPTRIQCHIFFLSFNLNHITTFTPHSLFFFSYINDMQEKSIVFRSESNK